MQHSHLASHTSHATTMIQLQQLLIDLLRIELNTQEIEAQHNFFDLGCQSLNLRILQMNLQRQLSRPIPITAFYTYPTIEMLARHLSTLHIEAYNR